MLIEDHPYVSIIIPAYNEEKYIGKCLDSILDLEYPKSRFEIIVVDNGSTDKTVDICRNYTNNLYICPMLNVAGLRNHGAKNAKGEIYAFIDGDCVADREWLHYATQSINIEECVTGAYCQIPPGATWVEETWGLRMSTGRHETTHVGTANFIVPAYIFNKIGGFNEKLKTGEDYEFCVRAKEVTKIIFDDRIKVTHFGNPKTIRQFIKREIWHGLGAFGSFRIKKLDKPLIGTMIFLALTILQIFSCGYILRGGSGLLFLYASIGIISLLIITMFVKIQRKNTILSCLKMALLYYFYYLARSISLVYLMFDKEYKRTR